jgi:hypothetical protein
VSDASGLASVFPLLRSRVVLKVKVLRLKDLEVRETAGKCRLCRCWLSLELFELSYQGTLGLRSVYLLL